MSEHQSVTPHLTIDDIMGRVAKLVAAPSKFNFLLRTYGKSQELTQKLKEQYHHAIVVDVMAVVGRYELRNHLVTIQMAVANTRQDMVIFDLGDLNPTSEHAGYLRNFIMMLFSDNNAVIRNIICVANSRRFNMGPALQARMINLDVY